MAEGAFVGRAPELSQLDAHLGAAGRGEPRVVIVEGPAGIGKTALVRRWLGAAADVTVVDVSGDENETRLAYGVVRQLADRLGTPGAELAPPGEDPLIVGSRLVDVLAMGRSNSLVVVVDDAHWVDVPSLRALTFTLRRLVAEPVMAVLVSREGDTLPDGLRRLADRSGLRVALGGLSSTELAELAGRVTGSPLAERVGRRLHEHTGGNPLHALALVEELDVEELTRATGLLPAPRSFAILVLARLRACSPETERLVTAAAVLGARCRIGEAARLAGLEDPAAALDEAIRAQLLAPAVAPSDVAFPHSLLRAAVYHDLGPARRSTLHAAAADMLPPPLSLDHRIAAAVGEDAELASAVVTHARREAADGLRSAAAGHLLDAARLTPDAAERGRLLAEAALELLHGGQISEAADLAVDLQDAPPSCHRSFALGLLALFSGRQHDAERLLAEAWEGRSELPVPFAVEASAYLSQLMSIQGRTEDTLLWASRAMEASGDPYVAPAFSVTVCHLWFAGRRDEARRLLDVDSATITSDAATELLLVRGLVTMLTDGAATARHDLIEAVRRCQPVLRARTGLIALRYLAEAEFRAGNWDAATARAVQAASLGDDAEQAWTSAFLHSMVVLPLAGRGQWHQAEAHASAAAAAAAALGDVASVGFAGSAAMLLASCRRRPAEVVAMAQPLLEARHRPSLDYPGCHYRWEPLLAEALVDLGRLDEAGRVVAAYGDRAAALQLRIPQADAACVEGRLRTARRELEQATAAFTRAASLLEGLNAPFEEGLVALGHGSALRRMGRRRAAADRLAAAAGRFGALGARPFLDLAERELVGTGLAPARRSSEDVRRRLTPQELAVAHLVATGATNREVAAELVVSVKTVEYHLANVFRKLGVSSRADLADALPPPAAPP